MPATGYTWKGDGIAPAGPTCLLFIHCKTESLHASFMYVEFFPCMAGGSSKAGL